MDMTSEAGMAPSIAFLLAQTSMKHVQMNLLWNLQVEMAHADTTMQHAPLRYGRVSLKRLCAILCCLTIERRTGKHTAQLAGKYLPHDFHPSLAESYAGPHAIQHHMKCISKSSKCSRVSASTESTHSGQASKRPCHTPHACQP